MRYISNIAAVAAFASMAFADDAPVQKGNPLGVTYTATLPNTGIDAITGQVIIAAAPDQEGVNIQAAFYNLPSSTGNMTYGIYTGQAGKNNDCSGLGALLNPYSGVTGIQCAKDEASCQIGDLSDKHGPLTIITGGSGTGYFSANYVDQYLSLEPGSEAFAGKGSIGIKDSNGASVACANLVNANKVESSTASGTATASMSMSTLAASSTSSGAGSKGTGKSNSNGSGSSASSTSSGSGAVRTAAPLFGAGVIGLAALLI